MRRKIKSTTPLFMISIMNVLGFLLLAFAKETVYDGVKTLITGVLFMVLLMLVYCLIRILKMGDAYLFLSVSAIMTIGLIMLCRVDPSYGEKQIVWFCLSVVCFFLAYFFYSIVKIKDKLFIIYALLSFGLFVATLLFGTNIYGATNWIYIGNQGFQPSELIRILFVLALSCLFGKIGRDNKSKVNIFIMVYVYLNLAFLVLQREWGIAVLFFLVYMAMHFAFGTEMKILLLNLMLAAGGGFLGYKFLYHIQTRVEMWLDPFSDPSGRGYQIVQSLIAMASGGFTGVGLGNGSPEFVPLVQSDFIFSAICEELGLLGGMAVILLYFLMAYRGFKITLATKDSFDKRVSLGITTMFAFQTFIILGGVIKLIPLTGITLPFISYGGSSLLTGFMALGILQAISKKESDSIE